MPAMSKHLAYSKVVDHHNESGGNAFYDEDTDKEYAPGAETKKRKASKLSKKSAAKTVVKKAASVKAKTVVKKAASVKAKTVVKKAASVNAKATFEKKKVTDTKTDGKLTKSERQASMITELIKLEEFTVKEVSFKVAAMFASYSNHESAGFKSMRESLAEEGSIDLLKGKKLRLTEHGKNLFTVPPLKDAAEALQRFQELVKMVNESSAPHSDAIIARLYDGQVHSKEALAAAFNYKNVGSLGFKSVFTTLKKFGFLEKGQGIKLKHNAFPLGPLMGDGSSE
ncbi:hypothetical protein MPSEU_000117200 [Mayamaea pseudoterrestris]|nr:hypothetical protein MPSEU_000117200 [Mayamaea pseudoterrestris]